MYNLFGLLIMYIFANLTSFLHAVLFSFYFLFLGFLAGRKILGFFKKTALQPVLFFACAQALGFAVLSLTIFIMGLLGCINTAAIGIVFFLVFPVLCCGELRKVKFNVRNSFLFLSGQTIFFKIVSFVFVFAVIFNFTACMLPPAEKDALKYHLELPKQYISSGAVKPDSSNIYSFFPELTEMSYTFGLLFSNGSSAKIIHFYFGLLTAILIYGILLKIVSPLSALLSAAIFYTTPVVMSLSGWPYVDLALTFYILLGLILFIQGVEKTSITLFCLAGLIMGYAFSIKYLAALAAICLVVLFLVYLLKVTDKDKIKYISPFAVFIAATLAAGSPWYIRNFIQTGNPFFPFFYKFFGGTGWDLTRSEMYDYLLKTHAYGMGKGIIDILLLPVRLVIHGSNSYPFDGIIGPAYLVLICALIFLRPKNPLLRSCAVFAGIFFFLWASLTQQVRFILPALAAFSISFANVFETAFTGKNIPLKFSFKVVFCALITANLYYPIQGILKTPDILFISGKINKEQYLDKKLNAYAPIKFINQNLRNESLTYFVYAGNIGYYCDKPYLQDSIFEDQLLRSILIKADSPVFIKDRLVSLGITHLLVNEHLAETYLYSDFEPDKKDLINEFRSLYLEPIFTRGAFVIYEIRS